MRSALVAIPCLLLAGCAPPHRFEIYSDEPIDAVNATFANSRETDVSVVGTFRAIVVVDAADSSGTIRILTTNGRQTDCTVGYVTNGEREPHRVTVDGGKCDVD
jgi:hypothetical protein